MSLGIAVGVLVVGFLTGWLLFGGRSNNSNEDVSLDTPSKRPQTQSSWKQKGKYVGGFLAAIAGTAVLAWFAYWLWHTIQIPEATGNEVASAINTFNVIVVAAAVITATMALYGAWRHFKDSKDAKPPKALASFVIGLAILLTALVLVLGPNGVYSLLKAIGHVRDIMLDQITTSLNNISTDSLSGQSTDNDKVDTVTLLKWVVMFVGGLFLIGIMVRVFRWILQPRQTVADSNSVRKMKVPAIVWMLTFVLLSIFAVDFFNKGTLGNRLHDSINLLLPSWGQTTTDASTGVVLYNYWINIDDGQKTRKDGARTPDGCQVTTAKLKWWDNTKKITQTTEVARCGTKWFENHPGVVARIKSIQDYRSLPRGRLIIPGEKQRMIKDEASFSQVRAKATGPSDRVCDPIVAVGGWAIAQSVPTPNSTEGHRTYDVRPENLLSEKPEIAVGYDFVISPGDDLPLVVRRDTRFSSSSLVQGQLGKTAGHPVRWFCYYTNDDIRSVQNGEKPDGVQ